MATESTRQGDGRILKRSKLSEQLANHLTDNILDGTFPVQQALPSERELARQYGVGVGVVREALRSLTAIGLVDVRHGVGTFVNPRESWNASAPMLLLIQSEPGSVLAVHDVRVPLELMSVERAAEKAGPEDIAALEDALDHMERNLDHPESNVEADLDFHLALARATHNPILLSVLQPLIEPIHECMLRGLQVRSAAPQAIRHHAEIVDAVRSHDPLRARHSMQRHMDTTRHELESLADRGVRPARRSVNGDILVPADFAAIE